MAPPAVIDTGVTTEKLRISDKIYARLRLAKESDVSHIYKLFYQIHEYHSLTHLYKVSEDSLCKMLFKENPNPPFYSPTILLVEVSATEFPAPTPDESGFEPIVKEFDLKAPVADDESDAFRSNVADHEAYIAGYAFFFPNYSCFYDKPGIFFESLYFRASYRKLGMGRLMFSTVAANAADKGFSSVEGIVAVWNKKSYDFYVDMGVEIMDEFRYGKLTGDALQAYAKKKSS
ncbi:PREDICTED: tyramine N-feruloyltransferase 4/11-like [Ipomoea nil]|uniref:tyramine N-feruloyltransferase 4/11-like n=1 Tax=Ipomoea nil TaxID=35883 RepID=UPI00090165D7|nr:PREDICTED: tyramine N-feruloyltransferase 4/11-like [Ipomoea nil]XP_019176564.1 PREDICTED: tyramine N-feruloyltransferase 4/11-like [Ipomoea nil]